MCIYQFFSDLGMCKCMGKIITILGQERMKTHRTDLMERRGYGQGMQGEALRDGAEVPEAQCREN